MDSLDPASPESLRVWRYLSFSRFVWLLQNKRLWLSRSDLLGDPWEISLAGQQLEHVISHHPPSIITEPGPRETAMERSKRVISLWRRNIFISCWCCCSHESHALWRIYCPAKEGVAIQTTLSRLRESASVLSVHHVAYETPGAKRQTPTVEDLVSKKRPMFAYEQEIRLVLSTIDGDIPNTGETLGHAIEWDPEVHLESIRVHPEADNNFMQTVTAAVHHYAPALVGRIEWSAMDAKPPF